MFMVVLILSAFHFEDLFKTGTGLPSCTGKRGGMLVFVEDLNLIPPNRGLLFGELLRVIAPDGVLAVSKTILPLQGNKKKNKT